jgi:glutaredoxin
MYKITIVALPSCKLCADLIDGLKENQVTFSIADATSHESLCDMLEVLLKTNKYPIATFEIPQRSYFICMPDDYERMGWKVLDETSTSIGVGTGMEMLTTILELKNKL